VAAAQRGAARDGQAGAAFFKDWDVVLTPIASGPAFPHDQAGERHDRTAIRVAGLIEKAWRGFAPPPG
jgi:amidase